MDCKYAKEGILAHEVYRTNCAEQNVLELERTEDSLHLEFTYEIAGVFRHELF
jgi:hypothetical protein